MVSESTRRVSTDFAWQELDKVRVNGKDQAMAIFCPVAALGQRGKERGAELKEWGLALKAYRDQAWDARDVHLLDLQRMSAQKYLYRLYAERVGSRGLLPFDPEWDGATNFETK